MAEELPDAPWVTAGKEELPDAPWAKSSQVLPHTVGEAASSIAEPFTSIPSTYQRMVGESVEQMKRGVGQISSGEPWEIAKGAGNVALGGIGYVGAPIAAPLHTIVGKPIEDVTGSPLAGQLAEVGASFALPMPKLPRGAAALPEEGPLGVSLSAGEKAGDMGMRQAEQAAIRGGDPHAVAWAAQRGQQMQSAAERIAQGFDPFGSTIAETPKEAGQLVSRGVQRAAEIRKAAVDAAYQEARGLPGELHADVFREMGNGIKADLSAAAEPVVVDDKLTPFASRMVQDIDNRVANLNIQNRASPYGRPDPNTIVGNLDGVDQMRKRLSAFRKDAYASGNRADGRAASAVLRAFDDRIDQAVNGGMFTGDRAAINAWNNARAAHSDYASTFKGRDPVGKVVQKVIGDNVSDPLTPGKVMDHLIGSSTAGLNNQTKIGVANRFKSILGETSPEWIGVKQGMARNLMQAAEGEATLGTGQTANRLAKFLNSDMAKAIYTPQEQTVLRSYADLMRRVTMPQGSYFPSAPGINPVLKAVMHQVAGGVGAAIGHFLVPGMGGEIGGYAAGMATAKVVDRAKANAIAKQLPLVGPRLQAWAKAQSRAQAIGNTAGQRAALAATVNLQKVLDPLGIDLKAITQQGPAAAGAQGEQPQGHQKGGRINAQHQRFADGGAPDDPYDPLAASAGIAPPGPTPIGSAMLQHTIDLAAAPGRVAAGQQPQTPGMWSDLDEAQAQANARGLQVGAPEAATMMMGSGTPFAMAEHGALGITGGRMPVGEAKAPPLYSAVERAVADAKTPQAPAQQWMGTLKNAPGVKPEELETLGVDDFLKGQKGPVTKQALAEHIAENKVDVQEVTLGDKAGGKDTLDTVAERLYGRSYDELGTAREQAAVQQQLFNSDARPTKFGQYTLPGGENYRELLLTLPTKRDPITPSALEELAQKRYEAYERRENDPPWERLAPDIQRIHRENAAQKSFQSENPNMFRSSHWDEPNVLAHVRFDDRNIGGDKTLHMAEVQSDWHQKGRREGYQNEVDRQKFLDMARSQYTGRIPFEQASRDSMTLAAGGVDPQLARLATAKEGVPDAPFKTTWPELALKRMIRYAAENGYDRISWDTGLTNAERYDLSKQVKSIRWEPLIPDAGKGTMVRIDPNEGKTIGLQVGKDGRVISSHYGDQFEGKHLSDIVGKETAEKIGAKEAGNLAGEGLKIGGEGMKAFYDRMLPNVANKLVKKYGARVEPQQVPSVKDVSEKYDLRSVGSRYILIDRSTGSRVTNDQFSSGYAAEKWLEREGLLSTPVHSIRITPELRDQALHRGFPMFSTGIPIPPHSTDKREVQGFAKGGAVNGKATKAAAEYKTKGYPPRICANCTMFRSPSFCTAVKGQISPQAVCKFFEAKKGVRRADGGSVDQPSLGVVGTTPSNFETASAVLDLTPQEQALYQRHLTNLTGPGGVDNPNGSRSTIFQMPAEVEGRYYNIPTVWDGKILPPEQAQERAAQEGWDKFPSYDTEDEAEARYQQMHHYMERDTGTYLRSRPLHAGMAGGGAVKGGRIDASHTVRTGANSSADGTVFVDPRIPARFRKFLAVHETTEQKHMAGGYARAHKIATAAERKAVEASGMSWRHYTAEMDGYLDHIEHEKDTNPPKSKLHVSAGVALGHHRSGNK